MILKSRESVLAQGQTTRNDSNSYMVAPSPRFFFLPYSAVQFLACPFKAGMYYIMFNQS